MAYLDEYPESGHLAGVYRSLRRVYYFNHDTLAEAATYKRLVAHEIRAGNESPYLFNGYAWSATVNNGRLWVGTMDWIYLLQDLGMTVLAEFLESEGITLAQFLAILEEDFPGEAKVAVLQDGTMQYMKSPE